MAIPAVLFSRGLSTKFPDVIKDANTMYFLTDTREIYLGNERFAFGTDVTVQVTGSGDTVSTVSWDRANKVLTVEMGKAADAPSIVAMLADALSNYVQSISAPRQSAVNIDSTDPQNPVVDLKFAVGCPEEGNVKFGQCSEGLYANVEIPEVPVTGVVANDKILSMDRTELRSTLSITTTKDTTTDKTFVVLQGIGGQEISRFDATDFVKHGLLQSAKLEPRGNPIHQWLILTFLIDGGHTQTLEADLTDLVDVYTAAPGGGLTLDNGAFSISNTVSASSGVNSDVNLGFGRTVALNTIMYDGHGSITGQKQFNVTMPSLSGSVGDAANSKLVTFVGLGDDGALIGNSVDIVTELSATSTNSQIPTAKTVYDAVEDARSVWNTFE